MSPLSQKVTLNDLRTARDDGRKVPMLTCYDYTTARLMQQAGVPALLVGDSAANVILGYPSTLPVSLEFMVEIAGGVRRGAPHAFLTADMPFGSYGGALGTSVKNVCHMVKQSACDCVKLEVAAGHAKLISALADSGVAVMAHLGLRPQSVALLGGYKAQGRTAQSADEIVDVAGRMARAGAVAILLEAVPAPVSEAVINAVEVPVIGCGAGRVCHGYVFVTHDALGLSEHVPRFAPKLGDLATPTVECFREYLRQVDSGKYPGPEQGYEMSVGEREKFVEGRRMRDEEIPF